MRFRDWILQKSSFPRQEELTPNFLEINPQLQPQTIRFPSSDMCRASIAVKDGTLSLKALSELKSKGLKIKAVIAGRGAQTPMMLQMLSDLQLTDCVDYLGPVAQEELPKLYASFDIFIFPSIRLNESLGLVGLEAMAAGIPVIASNMAGPAGYVRHNVNGYLFQPGNHTELAKAISLFLNATPEVQNAMRTAAAETAKKYDSKKVVEEMYDKLLSIT